MIKRTTIPEEGNKFYNTTDVGGYSKCIKGNPQRKGLNVLSNCVGWACGRYNEIIGEMKYPTLYCNAEKFIDKAKKLGLEISEEPTLGGIMVWEGYKDLAGHVAIVEELISTNEINTSESNYGGIAFRYVNRKNDNKRWGIKSNKYRYLGCVVNPAIGRVVAVETKKEPKKKDTKIQTYKTLCDLYVRAGAGTVYAIKKVSKLTTDGQRNAKYPDLNANAVYKEGTIFNALSIVENDFGKWAKTPSGFVCLVGKSGKEYCELIK